MASANTLAIQRAVGQPVRRATKNLPGPGSWPHRGGVPIARADRALGRLPITKGWKPEGRRGWRIEHGQRTSRVTDHGGRAHTVHSFSQAAQVVPGRPITVVVRPAPGRAGRRKRIAATRKRVA